MAISATSLSRSGLRDWLVQRTTALYMVVYLIFLAGVFCCHPHLDYSQWRSLFAATTTKVLTLLFFLSLVLHAWIGLWTVFTDYIKIAGLRMLCYLIVLLALLSTLIWSAVILWSV